MGLVNGTQESVCGLQIGLRQKGLTGCLLAQRLADDRCGGGRETCLLCGLKSCSFVGCFAHHGSVSF